MTQRRLFLGLALAALLPGLARAQGTLGASAAAEAPATRPRRTPLPRKNWSEMTARQHRRLLDGMAAQAGGRAPTEAEAQARWDAMAPPARRALVHDTRRHRQAAGATAPR